LLTREIESTNYFPSSAFLQGIYIKFFLCFFQAAGRLLACSCWLSAEQHKATGLAQKMNRSAMIVAEREQATSQQPTANSHQPSASPRLQSIFPIFMLLQKHLS
jgi:hypothetical protein